jgi:hypothetical protein
MTSVKMYLIFTFCFHPVNHKYCYSASIFKSFYSSLRDKFNSDDVLAVINKYYITLYKYSLKIKIIYLAQ